MSVDTLYMQVVEDSSEKALERLYYQLVDKLFSIALSITKCNELAEEVIEDVFIKLWKAREKSNIKNIEGFLVVSVRNLSLDYLRKSVLFKTVDINSCNTLEYSSTPMDEVEYMELKTLIDQAIDNLPPKCKESFVHVRMRGMSYKEAALALCISPKTVENQLRIAVSKILNELNSKYDKPEKLAS
jgi:RNA polymerase sigma-70 factor (ECF subfamily)